MEELLRLPMSLSRLLMIAVGLVVVLLVVGTLISWPIAVLIVGFSALALPFMIAVWRAEHG
jgi:hypothetical protein